MTKHQPIYRLARPFFDLLIGVLREFRRNQGFLLAGAIGYFRYLKYGLPVVLVFMGVEMLLDPHDRPPRWIQVDVPISVSLLVVAGILLASIVLSIFAARHEDKHTPKTGPSA